MGSTTKNIPNIFLNETITQDSSREILLQQRPI